MPKIFDRDGNEIAEFELSEKMQAAVDAGEAVTLVYHTPQLHRSVLGNASGGFTLQKIGARVVALDPASVGQYVAIQRAVKKARGLE